MPAQTDWEKNLELQVVPVCEERTSWWGLSGAHRRGRVDGVLPYTTTLMGLSLPWHDKDKGVMLASCARVI